MADKISGQKIDQLVGLVVKWHSNEAKRWLEGDEVGHTHKGIHDHWQADFEVNGFSKLQSLHGTRDEVLRRKKGPC